MLKKITFDNFRSFKNRVTVELTKTSYNRAPLKTGLKRENG